jgi:hypothetical protein
VFLPKSAALRVQITVNCDISTFAWLMAYVKAGGRGQQPQTTLDNCLRLLLASHYLQVGQLLQSFLLHSDLHDCAPILCWSASIGCLQSWHL